MQYSHLWVLFAPICGVWASTMNAPIGEAYDVVCADAECHHLQLKERPHLTKRQQQQQQPSPPLPQSSTVSSNVFATGNGMIQYTLDCADQMDPDFCKNARVAFGAAGDQLARILAFSRPLAIHVTFKNFCDPVTGRANDRCSQILGYGRPSTYYRVGLSSITSARDIVYPQALAKQVNANFGGFVAYDIEMEINLLAKDSFYFGPEITEAAQTPSQGSIRGNQHDFQYIIAHEQIHGLGMVTFWDDTRKFTTEPVSSLVQARAQRGTSQRSAQTVLISPPIQQNGQEVTVSPRVGIFDYLLMDIRHQQRFHDVIPSIQSVLTDIRQGRSPDEMSSQSWSDLSFSSITPQSVIALIPKQPTDYPPNTRLPSATSYMYLHSERNQFAAGSSLVHVDSDRYGRSEEFLMRAFAPKGQTLAQWVQRYGGPCQPLGRGTVGMLLSMGYTVQPEFESTVMQYVSGTGQRDGTKLSLVLALLLSLVVMF